MINRMNRTTNNANPDPAPVPPAYPLIEAPPLFFCILCEPLFNSWANLAGTFLCSIRLYVIVALVNYIYRGVIKL